MTYDISLKICSLIQSVPSERGEWPMYSYERPAIILWNAIASSLHEKGWSDEEIKKWLQSRSPRWALDGSLGEMIEELGKSYAEKISKTDIDY